MPHRRPGWALPNGHIVRSQTEAALCEYLDARAVAHQHWALNFELPTRPAQWQLFTPSILLTETTLDDRAVVIEPVVSLQVGGGLRRLQSFRKRHGREYFVIVVTRRALHRRIPEDARDAIIHIEDFEGLGELLSAGESGSPRK